MAQEVTETLIRTREAPTDEQLAVLRGFFMPKQPATPKTAAQWALKARAVKDVRHFLTFANVKGGELRASDGHRLHVCPTDLPDGYYDSTLAPIDEGIPFPAVDQVFPPDAGRAALDLSDLSVFPIKKQHKIDCTLLVAGAKFGVDRRYLLAAVSHPAGIDCAFYDGDGSAVVIRYKDGSRAAIMPVRLS